MQTIRHPFLAPFDAHALLLHGIRRQVNLPEEDMKDSPLFCVVKSGSLPMLELLLAHDCDATAIDEFGKGALHVAVYVTTESKRLFSLIISLEIYLSLVIFFTGVRAMWT